jgi:hypothetical protein
MTINLNQVTKDITRIDADDLLSSWRWRLAGIETIIAISVLGDLFLLGEDSGVYWLQTDHGNLTKVADSNQEFHNYLNDDEKFANWFLPTLIEKLINAGKSLKENEVYSFKKMPAIGGDYSVDNMEATDMSVHFAFTGQICEQIKELLDGTRVNIKLKP